MLEVFLNLEWKLELSFASLLSACSLLGIDYNSFT